MPSAVADLGKALYKTTVEDPTLTILLSGKKVYDLFPPQGTVPPYIVLGSIGETNWNVFNGPGKSGNITIHIWVNTSKRQSLAIYWQLEQLLNRTLIPIDNHVLLRGELDLITIMNDNMDPGLIHTVANYSFITKSM